MVNVSVQYNGGFLLDVILLTQCYYEFFLSLQPMTHLNVRFDISPLTGGCSEEGLDAFRFFFKQQQSQQFRFFFKQRTAARETISEAMSTTTHRHEYSHEHSAAASRPLRVF